METARSRRLAFYGIRSLIWAQVLWICAGFRPEIASAYPIEVCRNVLRSLGTSESGGAPLIRPERRLTLEFLKGEPVVLDTPIFRQWKSATSKQTSFVGSEESEMYERVAVAASRALFAERGIAVTEIQMGKRGETAFKILPGEDSTLNQLASEFGRDLPGIRLVYAPSFLMRGTHAFFSENDAALGISHEMLATGVADESFHHEAVIHAAHDRARRKGILDPLNPYAGLIGSEVGRVIVKTHGGYGRRQTFEEVEAYVESVVLLAEKLTWYIGRKLSSGESRAVEELLGSIRYVASTGLDVSVGTIDLASRALSVQAWKTDSGWKPVRDFPGQWSRALLIDSYTSEVANRWTVHKDGAEIRWRISPQNGKEPSVTAEDLQASLRSAKEIAERMVKPYQKVRDSIAWSIERADVGQTNLGAVVRASRELDETFYLWKKVSSSTSIPLLFDGK
ncbi:MAG: hypothetical protein H7301_14845 [Cryobacterium sp.]|nr:hypothetical protein [Oligoflexia bacterium]